MQDSGIVMPLSHPAVIDYDETADRRSAWCLISARGKREGAVHVPLIGVGMGCAGTGITAFAGALPRVTARERRRAA